MANVCRSIRSKKSFKCFVSVPTYLPNYQVHTYEDENYVSRHKGQMYTMYVWWLPPYAI